MFIFSSPNQVKRTKAGSTDSLAVLFIWLFLYSIYLYYFGRGLAVPSLGRGMPCRLPVCSGLGMATNPVYIFGQYIFPKVKCRQLFHINRSVLSQPLYLTIRIMFSWFKN